MIDSAIWLNQIDQHFQMSTAKMVVVASSSSIQDSEVRVNFFEYFKDPTLGRRRASCYLRLANVVDEGRITKLSQLRIFCVSLVTVLA